MYLKSKKIAFLGLLTAFTVVLIILSGVFEFSTFFFLALAAFCVGIATQEAGVKLGAGVFVASVILGLLVAPNKLYCFTYSALTIYILAIEFTVRVVDKKVGDLKQRRNVTMILKFIYFNLIYLPILFLLPKLIYQGEFTPIVYVIAIVGGQMIFYLFDRVYFSFMEYYNCELRKHLPMD